MKPRPVVPRERAVRDVDEAVAHYLAQASPKAAAFIDDLERAFGHIGRMPTAGPPRHAHELNIPGLRVWPLRRYPYIVFYVERAEHVDVWRVLHAHRDIPQWMRAPSDD